MAFLSSYHRLRRGITLPSKRMIFLFDFFPYEKKHEVSNRFAGCIHVIEARVNVQNDTGHTIIATGMRWNL